MGNLSDFGAFGSTGNIRIQRNVGGLNVQDASLPGHWAKITGGTNPYSHVSVGPKTGGDWQTLPQSDPYEWGTTTTWPAYEVNGDPAIPAGTIVWMEPEYYSKSYRFIRPFFEGTGSGNGSGSGGEVGGCCPNEKRIVDMRCIGDDLFQFVVTNDSSGNPGPQVPELVCAGFCANCTAPPTGSCTVPLPCPPDVCVRVPVTSDGGTTTPVTHVGVGGTVWTGGTNPSGTITIANGRGVWTLTDGTVIRAFPAAGYNPQSASFSLVYPRFIYSPPGGLTPTVIEGSVSAMPGSCDPPTCASVNPDSLPGTLNFVVSGVPAPCGTTNATYVGTAAGSGTSRHWDTTSIPCSFMGGSCTPGSSSGSNQLKLGCTAGVYTLTAITGMGTPCNAIGTGPYAAVSGEASPFFLQFTVATCLFITGTTGTCTVTVSE